MHDYQQPYQEVPEEISETTPLLKDTQGIGKSVWKDEFQILRRYSSSLVVANLLQFSLNLTNIIVVGGRGKIELGAVSIASMTANITGLAVFQGLSTSLDTLCAQAWGSGNKTLVGLHVQRMILLLWCIGIPIAVLWFNAFQILSRILPDAQTAALAGLYLRVLTCGIPGFAAFEAGKRLLTAQGIFLPITYILCIGASANILASWLFVWVSINRPSWETELPANSCDNRSLTGALWGPPLPLPQPKPYCHSLSWPMSCCSEAASAGVT